MDSKEGEGDCVMWLTTLQELKTSIEKLNSRMDEVERQCHVLEFNEKANHAQTRLAMNLVEELSRDVKKAPDEIRYCVRFPSGMSIYTKIKPTKQRIVDGKWQDMDDTE